MSTLNVQPARGTRDFLPDEVRRRQYVIDIVRDVYQRYGFEPLETPAFENIETLLGKYGDEGNKLIFKILRRGEHEASGEADLALRYDLTVPLARVVAQYQNELPKFFKRYQIQPVWRADRPARGRFREFYQCDIDTIGSTSPLVEVEQLSAVSEVLIALGFRDFKIRLNHRRLLPMMLVRDFSIVDEAAQNQAIVALDKLDKIGAQGVADEMARRGLTTLENALEGLKRAMDPEIRLDESTTKATLESLKSALSVDPGRELADINRLCDQTPAAGKIVLDRFLARGLSYYTGAIMEVAVPDLAGSLGGGGRYDNLIGMFLGRDVPACGFSLGLERIIVVMTERNMFPPDVARGAADVLVALWNAESQGDALALAGELRRAGLRVEVYPEADKIGKQFKYAATRRFPFVAVVGDDERANGTVSVKNLGSGSQETVARAMVVDFVRRQLGRSAAAKDTE